MHIGGGKSYITTTITNQRTENDNFNLHFLACFQNIVPNFFYITNFSVKAALSKILKYIFLFFQARSQKKEGRKGEREGGRKKEKRKKERRREREEGRGGEGRREKGGEKKERQNITQEPGLRERQTQALLGKHLGSC